MVMSCVLVFVVIVAMSLPRIGTSAEPLPQQRAPAPTPEPVKSDETWSSTASTEGHGFAV